MKVDALIISDPGIIALVKKNWKNAEIHLSTQANCTNLEAVKFWAGQGLKRIILGREVTLKEIKEIHRAVPKIELEYFVHGAMCMAYSGRCFLSKMMLDRSGNLGDCAQPCRWEYDLKEFNIKTGNHAEELELVQERHGSYLLNSRDLCLIKYLKELAASDEIIEKMNLVRRIVELGLAKRDEAGIKIRQMLNKITIKASDKILSAEYLLLISDELNIKTIDFKAPINENEKIEIELDTIITAELKQEGIKRDFVRLINMNRKDNGFTLTDSALIYFSGLSAELQETLELKKEEIKTETLSAEIKIVDALEEDLISKEVKIDDCKFLIAIKKK